MGAGAWYIGSGYGDILSATANRANAEYLKAEIKNDTFISHPVIRGILARDAGMVGMAGGLAARIGLIDIGGETMADTNVGSKASSTNFTAGVVDITPTRRQLVVDVSDEGTQAVGEISVEEAVQLMDIIVRKGAAGWRNKYTSVLLALISSLSLTCGTTNTDLTWLALFNGILDARNRGNRGAGLAVLNVTAVKKLAADTSSYSGALAFSRIAQQLIETRAEAGQVVADFNGCSVIMLDGLPTSGVDTYGALLFDGVWGSKHKQVAFQPGAIGVYNVGNHRCEAIRGNGTDVSQYSFTTYMGAAEVDDNKGTRIIWKT